MSTLAALREDAVGLDPERCLGSIDHALGAWRDATSPFRARLRETHPVFSPAVLDLGCELGLAGWTGPALSELRAREVPPVCRVPGLTAVWLAGSIPSAAFAAMIPPLLLGSALYVKPAAADPVSPALFRDSLLAADAGVGRAVLIGDDPAAIEEADAVVVHGRDETVSALRSRVPAGRIFVGHGHRVSLAAVGRDTDVEEAAGRLAIDVALYDGRGCLSPSWVLVEDTPRGRGAALARALARELERLASSLPRGRVDTAEEIRIHEMRAGAAMREGAELITPGSSTSWSVILEPAGERYDPGMLRTVPLAPFSEPEELLRWCASLAPHLSSLGHAGFRERMPLLVAAAARGGASRICPVGRMQCPPVAWHHDGQGPLAALIRHLDVEEERR